MKDFMYIGSTPPEEDCVQVGADNYHDLALAECRRYIEVIRKKLGPEPQGAKLKIKWENHDFGPYCEVVCWYDDDNKEATNYAFKCESHGPMTWSDD